MEPLLQLGPAAVATPTASISPLYMPLPMKPSSLDVAISGCPKNRSLRVPAFHCSNLLVLAAKQPHTMWNIIVRSDVVAAGASTGVSSWALSESQVSARAKGVRFYSVTTVAAIFLFVAMVAVHPFVLLFERYRRRAQHYIAMIWATLNISPFYKLEVVGMENLPSCSSPTVYVANHQSFLDIYTLLTLRRCFKFISKTSIFMFPIIGWAMYLMGVIPLWRIDSRSQLDYLKRCVDLVNKGASVFFFPEGTRSKDGKLGVFKTGTFSVARKIGAPVIPITLLGTGKLMPSGMEGILNLGSVKVIIHHQIEGKMQRHYVPKEEM